MPVSEQQQTSVEQTTATTVETTTATATETETGTTALASESITVANEASRSKMKFGELVNETEQDARQLQDEISVPNVTVRAVGNDSLSLSWQMNATTIPVLEEGETFSEMNRTEEQLSSIFLIYVIEAAYEDINAPLTVQATALDGTTARWHVRERWIDNKVDNIYDRIQATRTTIRVTDDETSVSVFAWQNTDRRLYGYVVNSENETVAKVNRLREYTGASAFANQHVTLAHVNGTERTAVGRVEIERVNGTLTGDVRPVGFANVSDERATALAETVTITVENISKTGHDTHRLSASAPDEGRVLAHIYADNRHLYGTEVSANGTGIWLYDGYRAEIWYVVGDERRRITTVTPANHEQRESSGFSDGIFI